MVTRKLLQLLALLLMAGQTGGGQVPAQDHFSWSVRILMAIEALLKPVMRSPHMAQTAGGNDFHHQGRMPIVAVQTGNAGFMGSPGFFDIPGDIAMAFGTVADEKLGFLSRGFGGESPEASA